MVASMARLVLPAACAMATAAVLLAVAAPADGSVVESIITQDVYSAMLPNLHNSSCPASGFYTYDAFIQAAAFFPGFGTTGGGDEYNRRELAAFFGQTSHETGGTRGAADQFQWGYCFKEEVSKSTSPPDYGRGPILLTGCVEGAACLVCSSNGRKVATRHRAAAARTAAVPATPLCTAQALRRMKAKAAAMGGHEERYRLYTGALGSVRS
ncbi:chitinase 8-like isoform X4 [Panicum virgatum]|uniref:chitinase 8-like isoform X4 n=1 Tax=Panicum virgatum TaxID=38727 RepID=UPI0019D669EC|nr:chitinase 8-like isoform X4 [Panicum virgatum]